MLLLRRIHQTLLPTALGRMDFLVTVQEMLKGGYSVGEVDSITGPLIGRPKSATFRTLDVVGLDTFVSCCK